MISRLRVVAYDVWGARRGVVPAVSEISVVQALNSVSSCDLTLACSGINADLMTLPVEFAVECWEGQAWCEYPNMRFIALSQDMKLEDPSVTRIKGLGVGQALGWATIWEASPNNEDSKRVFNAQPPGQFLDLLLREAQERRDETRLSWAPGLEWDFNSGHDSANSPWPRNVRSEWNRSDTLLKVLGWLSEKGAIDWRMNGRCLQVYASGGEMENHLDNVRLREAFSSSMPVSESWLDLATVARFAGDEGFLQEKSNPAVARALGRIERWSEQGQVTLPETARLYLDSLLTPGARPAMEYRREWAANLHPTMPYPFQDYQLGDWVLIDPVGPDTELRIVEIQIKQDNNGGITGAEALGTRIESLVEKLARRTTDLSSGQVGGENGKPTPINNHTGEPLTGAPQALTLKVTQIPDEFLGGMKGAGQASWQPVAGAKEYQLQTLDTGAWATVTVTTSTGSEFPTLGTGVVTARVRAVNEDGSGGPWSAEVTVNVDTGETLLPYPSKPAISSRLGILTVEWDGLSIGADGLPAGLPTVFNRLEIAATPTPAPPKDATQIIAAAVLTRRGAVPLTGLAAGSTIYIYTRIVDLNGKTGPWQTSEPSQVVVRRVEAADLEANNISANTAVMGSLMAGLANVLKLNAGQVTGETAEFATALIDKLKVQTAAIDTLFTTLFQAHKVKAHNIDANYAEIGTLYVGGYKIDPVALQGMGTVRNPLAYGSTSIDGTRFEVGNSSMDSSKILTGSVKINGWGNGWIPRLDGETLTGTRLGIGWQNGDSVSMVASFSLDGSNIYCNSGLHVGQNLHADRMLTTDGPVMGSKFVESSTAESKAQVEPVRDLTGILGVEPVAYRPRVLIDEWRKQFGASGPSRPLRPLPERLVGWRAEDLEAAGLGICVAHDPDTGKPVGVEYSRLTVALWQVLKQQREEIDVLKTRLGQVEKGVGV